MEFIHKYKDHPVLWKVKFKEYANRVSRNRSYLLLRKYYSMCIYMCGCVCVYITHTQLQGRLDKIINTHTHLQGRLDKIINTHTHIHNYKEG